MPFLIPIAKPAAIAAMHLSTKRKVAALLKEKREFCVEIGSGDKKRDGWTTVDVTKNCDLYWDLRYGIPFPNKSVKKIYSSHLFEHLSFQEARKLLAECRRVLVPGGKFLICVPNARLYLEAYARGETLDPNIFFGWKPAYNNTTRIDYANYVAYMDGGHKYMFDEENLVYILKLNGLRNARLRSFDAGLDMPERDHESIYAEAEK
jgi:predicted SAM-dependent methyltransferase